MAKIDQRRMAAEIDGDFVVFIIGARINRPWKVWRWLPVILSMPRMLKELERHPNLGLLSYENQFGLLIQYWRSFEQLESYARSQNAAHFPVWVAFNKRIASNGDVGIWHETFLVPAGQYEAVYHNMPPRGLAKAGRLAPAIGRLATAAGRAGIRSDTEYPNDALGGLKDPSSEG